MNRRARNNLTVTFFFFALLLFLLGVMAGCGKKNPGNGSNGKSDAVPVNVVEVKPGRLSISHDFVGNIKAEYEAEVYPKVSGKIMEKVKNEGDRVEKDEPLMYIDRDEVGLKFEKAPVQSPIKGVVGLVYADVGQRVQPTAPVAYVVDMEKVKINIDVPEKTIGEIRFGQDAEVRVDTYPDKVFIGKITRISPVLDPMTRTSSAEVSVDNKEGLLKPGMFARVSIVTHVSENVDVVMKEAVIGKEPDTFVYVIKDNKAMKKKIELGLKQDNLIEVKSGLQTGDQVVVIGQQKLYENAPVVIEPFDMRTVDKAIGD
jgi:multidrug efflux pump subunit AcrA (membrane-fusion protein)